MDKQILITESALDVIIINNSFEKCGNPKPLKNVHVYSLSSEIIGIRVTNEPPIKFYALIDDQSVKNLMEYGGGAVEIYRRIARVVKGMRSPPIHLPRHWMEFHHKNLMTFFAFPREKANVRWVVEISGDAKCARFTGVSTSDKEIDLTSYSPSPWPTEINTLINELLSKEIGKKAPEEKYNIFAEQVDLTSIGSGAVVGNKTYDEWLSELTTEQKKVVDDHIGKSIRIIGPAGSGKTLTLCMRAIYISRNHDVVAGGKKILIATHSWAMAERIDSIVRSLNDDHHIANITVFPLLGLLEYHAGHIGHYPTEIIGDDSTDGRAISVEIISGILNDFEVSDSVGLSDWIVQGIASRSDGRNRFDLAANLYEEITGVLGASGVAIDDLQSFRKYIDDEREEWMPPFDSAADRNFVVKIYRSFMRQLVDRSAITTDQFILDSIRKLETYAWRMRKETDGYDYIIIDELQLFDPQERFAIMLLGRSKFGVPFITAEDPSQGVFSALNGRNNPIQNEPLYLNQVHRFNMGIYRFIEYIYRRFPLNTTPLSCNNMERMDAVKPRLYLLSGDEYAIQKAVELSVGINAESVSGVRDRVCITTLGDVDEQVVDGIKQSKGQVIRLRSYDDVEQLSYIKKAIIVAPWQFIGGTQFSHVIVLTAGAKVPYSQFGRMQEHIAVYLSCSRAESSLSIVCGSHIPSIIGEAEEEKFLAIES